MRGATSCRFSGRPSFSYFNPRSSCEERPNQMASRCGRDNFNPRSSCEERQAPEGHAGLSGCDFNPRSSCEERLPKNTSMPENNDFNPRSSCEERLMHLDQAPDPFTFQSTLLMRGATYRIFCHHVVDHISIHAPHARSDQLEVAPDGVRHHISIHAPHARSDQASPFPCSRCHISIHAPHARSDASHAPLPLCRGYFNPRSSCEERPRLCDDVRAVQISIHAPHARSDSQ